MINDNIKFLQSSLPSNLLQCTDSNILNLPNEIKASQQFCFWKYVYVKNSVKPAKVPYGYSKEKECLVPSLKDKNYWFTFDDFFSLSKLFPESFKLGLVLINGPFTAIDIDSYQMYKPLDILLDNMLKKGAYIEVSPGGKGLHIFYQGTWNHQRNKGTNLIVSSEIETACEVYSGKDIRFITLTGQKLLDISQKRDIPLVSTSDILRELRCLQEIFFDPLEEKQSSKVFDINTSMDLSNNVRKSHADKQLEENINELDFQELN